MRRGLLDHMSTKIAVRLPDEMVALPGPHRRDRQGAEQDAQILRTQGAADELDDLVEWTGTHAVVED